MEPRDVMVAGGSAGSIVEWAADLAETVRTRMRAIPEADAYPGEASR